MCVHVPAKAHVERTPVRPPTMSPSPFDSFSMRNSIDCLLQLLHWQHTNGLACWLGLEDTWLLCEWIDSLACRLCGLLLQLHVEDTTKLEASVLLQLAGSQLHIACDDCLHLLRLQFNTFSHS